MSLLIGSSSFCDINLKYHHTVNESEVLTVVQNVCGYPIPELKWKVGDDNFSTASSPSVINNETRQYEYSFKTRHITRKDCGRNLTFVTSNTIGSIERNAKIDVKFVPSPVSMVSLSSYNGTCVRVTWDGEDTGKCILNYHVWFSGREITYNTSNTYFTLCNATDVRNVTVWASYNANVEEHFTTTSSPDITLTTNSTTTLSPDITSTRNIATTNAVKCVQRTCDCQSTSNITVSIIVTLAITLILITIVFIISKQKGFIIVIKRRKRPPQIYKNRSTEAESTISHYSDVDAKALKYICKFANDD
ncbi:uncharacterized protein LOC130636866 [Hydractinia symbiolongicarpus]|uniref:uncharacterized protein LOC130636866 n=1 Tax=Hydractinia symbiolongicarpus TaxID=13093 RepID=UPI00254A8ABA|nr:uncharacterized protein LOC130636866 [Hydractinia symbiolongicarpus]